MSGESERKREGRARASERERERERERKKKKKKKKKKKEEEEEEEREITDVSQEISVSGQLNLKSTIITDRHRCSFLSLFFCVSHENSTPVLKDFLYLFRPL